MDILPDYVETGMTASDYVATCSRCGFTVTATTIRQLTAAMLEHRCVPAEDARAD